jgi:hypothetical protein
MYEQERPLIYVTFLRDWGTSAMQKMIAYDISIQVKSVNSTI